MERAPGECILCGGTSRVPLTSDGKWSVHKCTGCGLGVLDPRPDPDELGQLYRKNYFVSHYEHVLPPESDGMRRRLSQERHRVDFFRRYRSTGKVLDIGSGRGYFLEACRLRGYDVVGFDVSDDAAASVRDAFGITVATGEMRDDLFEPGSLDVVTMWHSLEHTRDPRIPLGFAWKWLSAGGILIVEVPNHEGTDAIKEGSAWKDWDLPYHQFHFTPESLRRILSRSGFAVLKEKRYHSEYVKRRIREVPFMGWLARPIARLYSGTGIAVLARKADVPTQGGACVRER